jgi:molecular chaperone GrpE
LAAYRAGWGAGGLVLYIIDVGRQIFIMDNEQVSNNGSAPAAEPAPADDALAQAQAQAAEYLDLLQRERAGYINYRRRMEQEQKEWQQYAGLQVLKKLLPIVDDFERALAAAPDPAANPWVAGLTMIDRKLHKLLEGEGVTPIEALNQPFDPNIHDAVEYEPGDGEDVVVNELARGYRMGDRVIRPAMVRVGKRASE